jgi:hypothetical protein
VIVKNVDAALLYRVCTHSDRSAYTNAKENISTVAIFLIPSVFIPAIVDVIASTKACFTFLRNFNALRFSRRSLYALNRKHQKRGFEGFHQLVQLLEQRLVYLLTQIIIHSLLSVCNQSAENAAVGEDDAEDETYDPDMLSQDEDK